MVRLFARKWKNGSTFIEFHLWKIGSSSFRVYFDEFGKDSYYYNYVGQKATCELRVVLSSPNTMLFMNHYYQLIIIYMGVQNCEKMENMVNRRIKYNLEG